MKQNESLQVKSTTLLTWAIASFYGLWHLSGKQEIAAEITSQACQN